MKRFFLLTLSLAALAPACVAAPAKPQLPPAARAEMVAGGQSLRFAVLPLGPNSGRALLHVWRVARGFAPQRSTGGGRRDAPVISSGPSLFCVDIFLPGGDPVGWKLATSAAFLGSSHPHFPTEVSTRWLRPKEKQGVVVVVDAFDALGKTETLVTFPEGVEEGLGSGVSPSYIQDFYSGNVGGGHTSLSYGVDARGFMTVIKTVAPHANVPPTKTVFAWNGYRFAGSE